jgi:hypothetical protein
LVPGISDTQQSEPTLIRTRLLTTACLVAALVLSGQGLSGPAYAYQAGPAPSSPNLAPLHAADTHYPLPQHQTLNYIVDWRVFPAGTATIHLDAEGNTERINTTGVDIGAVNLLFKVNDRFQSALDRHTGCSQYFNKQLQEGHRQITSSLSFNGAAGQQVLDEKNMVKGTTRHQQAAMPPCVSDLMSAIFYGATQELTVGESFVFPVADAMRTINVTMKVEARERVITPAGTFDTIRVQPTADAGVVKNRGNIWIWYTDDVRHIPVQMRARLFWGTITLRLSSFDQK